MQRKTNLVFDVSVDTNVEQGVLFHMPSGQISIVHENLKYFTFFEFQEEFNFSSSDPPAIDFIMLFIELNCYVYVE